MFKNIIYCYLINKSNFFLHNIILRNKIKKIKLDLKKMDISFYYKSLKEYYYFFYQVKSFFII